MTNLPIELAEQHAKINGKYDPLCATCRYMRNSFLAGYKAAQPQWISVKNRLPKIFEEITACLYGKDVCPCRRMEDRKKDQAPLFYANTKQGLLICSLESITHWMPLPQPPKEENE